MSETLQQRARDEALVEQMAEAAYRIDRPNGAGYDYDMRKYWEVRMKAALAVLQPRLDAAEKMAKALRFVQHRDSRWRDDDAVMPALALYNATTQPAEPGEGLTP